MELFIDLGIFKSFIYELILSVLSKGANISWDLLNISSKLNIHLLALTSYCVSLISKSLWLSNDLLDKLLGSLPFSSFFK